MELGVAGTIVTEQISGDFIQPEINVWLQNNADVEVLDIKFSASATGDDWGNNALIIYRKELNGIEEIYDKQIQTLKDAKWLIEKLASSLGVDIDDLEENYNNSYNELTDIIEQQKKPTYSRQ